MSREAGLRTSVEFRKVYARGRRYDGRFMSAFVLPNHLEHHRLGITASRKAVGNAVKRNRSRRLLREAFRLSAAALNELDQTYDWVLNGKRSLLQTRLAGPLAEFQVMVARAASHEEMRGLKVESE